MHNIQQWINIKISTFNNGWISKSKLLTMIEYRNLKQIQPSKTFNSDWISNCEACQSFNANQCQLWWGMEGEARLQNPHKRLHIFHLARQFANISTICTKCFFFSKMILSVQYETKYYICFYSFERHHIFRCVFSYFGPRCSVSTRSVSSPVWHCAAAPPPLFSTILHYVYFSLTFLQFEIALLLHS